MKTYQYDNFELEISVDNAGGLIFRLAELDYCLGVNGDKTQVLSSKWSHETMYFPSLNSLSKIKVAIKHWLSRYSEELSAKSIEFLHDFLSNADNLKIARPEPTPTPALPPPSNTKLN